MICTFDNFIGSWEENMDLLEQLFQISKKAGKSLIINIGENHVYTMIIYSTFTIEMRCAAFSAILAYCGVN